MDELEWASGVPNAVWARLARLDPTKVCRRARVTFNPTTATYTVPSFGYPVQLLLNEQRLHLSPEASPTFQGLELDYLTLNCVWYLVSARDFPPAGRLVKPSQMPGGQIYVKGSHILPLDQIAAQYGTNPQAFISQGQHLKGELLDYGDAALRLWPFPRTPMTLILWQAGEFPARADLLLDANCDKHLPPDIIWSTCMMTVEALLQKQAT